MYTFNAKDLNGKSVVAFATLKDKDGNIICSEKDLDEPDQSVSFTNPPAPPTTPPEPPTPPVTPPDEPPVVPSDKPGAPLAKTSDMLQLGLGLLALGAGVGLISYGIYRKRKKRV